MAKKPSIRSPKKGKITPENLAIAGMVQALQHVSIAQKSEGQRPYGSHCVIANRQVIAFDGILCAGAPINDDLIAAPHTYSFLNALVRCKDGMSMTHNDTNRVLTVRSGGYRANISCEDLPTLVAGAALLPDPPQAALSDSIREGFRTINTILKEGGQTITENALLLRDGTMIGTDRKTLLEYWHGNNFPRVAVPKAFIDAVCKSSLPLEAFGVSEMSITFYFVGGAWIRSQLYREIYPDTDAIFNAFNDSAFAPVPEGFFDAMEAAAEFSPDDCVCLYGDVVASHPEGSGDIGAAVLVNGLFANCIIGYGHLLKHRSLFTHMALETEGPGAYLYGNGFRAAVAYGTR